MRSLKSTLVLKVSSKNPDKAKMLLSAKVLKGGGLIAFPTETVYGLAADLSNKRAIARLYKVKRRPKDKPFTVHISSVKMIRKMNCGITKEAKILIDRFWPGPLTIILRSKSNKKIGFRMPDNKIALALIEKVRVPIVAPSANISGRRPPKDPKDILRDFDGKIDLVLDGGRTEIGTESTVVDLTTRPPKILREGAVKKEDLFGVLRYE